MNLKLTILCLISSLGLIQSGELYDIAGRKYFISYPLKANFYGALKYCNSQNMYLLDIISDAENSRVTAILNAFKKKSNTTGSYWTSATDLGSEGSFYWASNGHPLHYTYWSADQPNNENKRERALLENCIAIQNSMWWDYAECEDEKYFICRDTFDVPVFAANRCTNTA